MSSISYVESTSFRYSCDIIYTYIYIYSKNKNTLNETLGLVDDEKLIKFHKIEWDQLKPAILSNYRQTTDSLLGDMELPDDIVDCSGVNCDNHNHINCLSELYGCIMHCLSKADKTCIPEQKKCHVSPVPGWNDYLAEPYKESREAYFLWCSYNKPRSGAVHEPMKKSRARFKYAQNQVLKNEKNCTCRCIGIEAC